MNCLPNSVDYKRRPVTLSRNGGGESNDCNECQDSDGNG
jgi:hypothetical protein